MRATYIERDPNFIEDAPMCNQRIELGFDKDAAWDKVNGRLSVFLDTNCWIEMADQANDTACRVREKLKALVSSGQVFCPLSWGLLEELLKQSGDSLQRTGCLMEELSLNVIYVMRTEVYEWEVARSVRRALGEPVEGTLNGLFAPPAAFVGSRFSLELLETSLGNAAQNDLREFMKRELGKIGVVELVNRMGASLKEQKPPAYSQAAKKAMEICKRDKRKLLFREATEVFKLYVIPNLKRFPPTAMLLWMEYFGSLEGEDAFLRDCLVHLPALHNFIEIMATVDSQPDRKDKYNDFIDYEIMVVPLAYSNAFVSRDKGIRDLLQHRTKILSRTACQYCDSLRSLDSWLSKKFA